jgi:hypothetical protein
VDSENGKSKTIHGHPNQITSGKDLTSAVATFTASLRKYRLTPWNKVTHNKLVVPQIFKKFPVFYETRKFITALTSARHPSLFNSKSTPSTLSQSSEINLNIILPSTKGRDSAVGIATRYGMDGPGIESQGRARFSAPVQTGPWAHPPSCTMGNGSFPGVKRPGCGVDHPPHLSPRLKKE